MSIPKKPSKAHSIFFLKCPRCHDGEMFETGSWSLRKPFDMLDRCPKCDLSYYPEPGYYYGSMFVSYIWTAFSSLGFVALFHWLFGFNENLVYAALVLIMAANFVYIFRVSRSMWLHFNIKYDAEAIAKHQKENSGSR